MLPHWCTESGCPVSSRKRSIIWMLLIAILASSLSAWICRASPAARGEVCETAVDRSTRATLSPRRARWKAVLVPGAPAPITTASNRPRASVLIVASRLARDRAKVGERHADLGRLTTVHGEHRPRHVRGLVRGQEQRRRRQLLRPGQTSDRHGLAEGLHLLGT